MKKVLALFLVLALFSGSFQVCFADSSDKVFFGDNGSIGGWSGASVSVDSSTKKTGSASAKLVYTASNSGTSFSISPFAVTDTSKMALQMWIKLPKNGGVPRLSVVMDIDGKNVEAEMPLADFIGKSDKARWTFLQIPLSAFGNKGKYWNNEKQQSEFPNLDWKKVKSLWFVHSNGGSGQYVCHIDDLKITSKFDPADNTPKGGSDGTEELDLAYAEPENRLDENGNRILVTIYEDDTSIGKPGKWTNPKSDVKSNRRFKKEGAESLQAHYEANNDYGGLTWTLNKPVALGEELGKNAALDMWVYWDKGDAPVGIKLFVPREDGNLTKVNMNIGDYVTKKGEWIHVTIPFSENDMGVYWTQESGNMNIVTDWRAIAGWQCDFSPGSYVRDTYFDNMRVILVDGNKKEKPMRLLTPESEYDEAVKAQNFTTVSLDGVVNMSSTWDGESGWIDQTDYFDNYLKPGVNEFLGIPFEIPDPEKNNGKNVIVTRGRNNTKYPTSVEIPVGGKEAKGIYFLHTAAWCDVTDIGSYIVEYTDGSQTKIKLTDGTHIGDWGDDIHSEYCKTVYKVWNESGHKDGCLQLFAWANIYPEKPIQKIIAKTTGSMPYLIVGGVTLTDSLPTLIRNEEAWAKRPEYDEINPDTSNWIEYRELPKDSILGTALDASQVVFDAPAGKHGHIKGDENKFVFEDGERVRLWGVNVNAGAIFQDHNKIDRLVNQIQAAGYNLVRFHHKDIDWANPNIHGTKGTSTRDNFDIDENSLEQFEYFWARCKEEGIYITTDLIGGSAIGYQGYCWYDETMWAKQKSYLGKLLTHVNPYTGTTLAEDPVVAFFNVSNENGWWWRDLLTWHFVHRGNLWRPIFANWLKSKYGSDEKVRAAWNQEGRVGWEEKYSVETEVGFDVYNFYKRDKGNYSDQKIYDINTFLTDMVTYYYDMMINWLKDEVGVKCMMTGTNCPGGAEGVYGDTLYNPDLHITNCYWGHPSGSDYSINSGIGLTEQHTSSIIKRHTEWLPYLGERTVAGIPRATTEWANLDPHIYAAEGVVLTSLYSAYNNWMQIYFAWQQGPQKEEANLISVWDMWQSPTKRAISPACSIMFLRGDIKEADMEYYYPASYDEVMRNATYTGEEKWTINTDERLPDEMHTVARAGVALSDHPWSVKAMLKTNKALENYLEECEKTGIFTATTGDFRMNNNLGLLEINTENTQGISGYNGEDKIVLDNIDLLIDNKNANVILTSLTDNSISESDHLLLSAVGRWRNKGMVISSGGDRIEKGGGTPQLLEPITGDIVLKTGNRYTVHCLNQHGERIGVAETSVRDDGAFIIKLKAEYKAVNYELVKDGETGNKEFARADWGKPQIETDYYGAEDLKGHWAELFVTSLMMKGAIEENNEFNPEEKASGSEIQSWINHLFADSNINLCEGEITREELFAEVAKYILHTQNYIDYKKTKEFSDMTDISEEYLYYIESLAGNDIISGDENNMIYPKRIITKAEAAAFIYKVSKLYNEWFVHYKPYSEVMKKTK